MKPINSIRLGFGIGIASVVLHLSCVTYMAIVSRETAIAFLNSIMHGLDVAPVFRGNIPFSEVLPGAVYVFVIGWFLGAIAGFFYNICPFCRRKEE